MLNDVNLDKYLIITQARTVLEEFKEPVTVGKRSLIQFRMLTAPQDGRLYQNTWKWSLTKILHGITHKKKKKVNQQQYSANTGGLVLGVDATDVFKASLTWQSHYPDKTVKVGHGQEPRALQSCGQLQMDIILILSAMN